MRVMLTIQFWTAVSTQAEDLKPIFHEEVEIAVAALKKGKAAGVENKPAVPIQAGGSP